MQTPSISIIIVNWNHGQYLRSCLDSLLAQEYKNFEICVVDNGSQDGSPQWIANDYPELNCWNFPNNRGFSKAFNWGVNHTKGELVLSLNPDVFVREDFLQELVDAMCEDNGVGIVSPKLLRDDDPKILDSTGLFIDRFRRPYDRGQGETDAGQYDNALKIFGACGAAALYRRTMLADIAIEGEYFDEDFFSYYEDADSLASSVEGLGCEICTWRGGYTYPRVGRYPSEKQETDQRRARTEIGFTESILNGHEERCAGILPARLSINFC